MELMTYENKKESCLLLEVETGKNADWQTKLASNFENRNDSVKFD